MKTQSITIVHPGAAQGKCEERRVNFLIVQEAGGKVTDFKGSPYSPYQPQIVATNGKIHEELLQWISGNAQRPNIWCRCFFGIALLFNRRSYVWQ